MKANYLVRLNTPKYILIEDLANYNGSMSVTNDAEAVIKDLCVIHKLNPDQTVYYIDTDGRVDILEHKNGEFTGFYFGYDNIKEFNENVVNNESD